MSTFSHYRWGDNDHRLGPFIYAHDKYVNFGVVICSGDDDYPGCRLRFSLGSHRLIIALPPVIGPWRKKVVVTTWDDATIARLGRNWYYDTHEREYGLSYSEGFLQFFLGRQTNDSSTEQRWYCFLPWTQWRHVRHSVYGLCGEYFATEPKPVPTELKKKGEWLDRYRAWQDVVDQCPTATFQFLDFDGERLTATTRIEEMEWYFGTGWFKWLDWFHARKVHRSLDIKFSGETGERKGSWKGGTVGHSIEMLSGELHESAFRRYCAEHKMTFEGVL